jgi:hypothetical protein
LYSNEEIDHTFDKILTNSKGLYGNFILIITKGDGNCFYYAISRQIFGTETHACKIRLGVLFILIEYQNFLQKLIKKSFGSASLQTLTVETSKMGTWANEYILLTSSILLNKPVYCYTCEKDDFLSHEYSVNKKQIKNQPVLVALQSQHFVPLLPVKTSTNITKPKFNQFKRFQLFKLKLY